MYKRKKSIHRQLEAPAATVVLEFARLPWRWSHGVETSSGGESERRRVNICPPHW